jgi:IPT/TIG domain
MIPAVNARVAATTNLDADQRKYGFKNDEQDVVVANPDAEQPARLRRRWRLRTGPRGLLLTATVSAMLLLGPATLAHATGVNVVPNPGFEQAGCGGNTPAICGWKLIGPGSACGGAGPCTFTSMAQDSNAHTGSASMSLFWGTDFSNGYGGVEAATDPAFCAQIGPGVHPASFWYIGDSASIGASFYQGADCTGAVTYASLGDGGASAWKQVTGVLVAPPGTQSALFSVSVGAWCDYAAGCSAAANFDDLDVEDGVVTTPTISSFTPTTGPAGTSVDIVGVNLTGATSVTFNGAAANFTVDSDSEIHAIVPDSAATGPISITTPNGTATSTSPFGVPPTITSFTPTCGPAGATVDILGSNFTGATSVTFTSAWYGNEPATFTVVSDSEIQAIVPSAATFGPVDVGTPGGATTSSSPFTGPCDSPPLVNSLTPNSGPVGTSVDIGGHYFTGATSVKFNGTVAVFTVDSDSEMHVTVPSGATTGPVSVTTPNGTTWNLSFTVTPSPPPTISSFTPTSGPPGTSVDIQGTNLTGATSVKFNGAVASYTVNSSTEITAHVPTGATSGSISVTTPGGTATSSSSFTVASPTTISSFTPTRGPVGTSVSITGSGFTDATSVNFNGTAASYTVNSPTSITTTVPSGATSGPISVTTPDGTGVSDGSFTVISAPTITSFTPSHGSAGTQVTIYGSNFVEVSKVKLGTIAAAFTVNSSTQITVTVPSITHGFYRWWVTDPAGTAASIAYFHAQ